MQTFVHFLCLFVITLFFSGCAKKEKTYEEQPMETLYHKGMDALEEGEYPKAAELLNEVERQHPYSIWAPRAQIMAAFAYYQQRHYDQAIGSLEGFLQLHPHHEYTPYAYYLQGICAYEQMSTVDRDPQSMELCVQIFNDLNRRFPETPYAKDARMKITMMRDHWAARELEIARFYQTRGETAAALLRLYVVLKDYQDTSQLPETLYRTVECYLALGLYDDARRSAGILGHNYPGDLWYQKAYQLLKKTIGTQPLSSQRSKTFSSPKVQRAS